MKLSVCLIVRDEEEVLARCLDCVKKFADEIVVCDTGSKDKTVEIAKRYTDNVVFFDWCDDFSAARNYCFEKACGDYLMWIDADDIIEDGETEKIIGLKQVLPQYDMAFLRYGAFNPSGEPDYVYMRERIFRNSPEFRFSGAVHEAVTPSGKIIYSDALILHKKIKSPDSMRNLRIYQAKIMRGEKLDARSKFYYGRELFFCGMLRESEAVLSDFLRGDGWIENKIEACINLYDLRLALGDREGAAQAVLFSFTLAPPRPRACCALGDVAYVGNNLQAAKYWYECALTADSGERSGAFVDKSYSRFIPYMRLCALHDRLGEYERAFAYNERAARERPDDKQVAHNRNYFKSKHIEVKNEL